MANLSDFTNSPSKVLVTTNDSLSTGSIPALGQGITADMVLKGAFTEWLAAYDEDTQSLVRTYRDYYDGQHKYQLTDRMKEFLQLDSNIKFDLNYLPIPVDILVERLNVEGFETEEERQARQQAQALPDSEETVFQSAVFNTWWQKNRMDAIQSDVHHASVRDADSYVLVGWDNDMGIPTFACETAYDGTNGVTIRYDESKAGRMKFAVKRWRIESGPGAGTIQRMNVYTPAAIYKFITSPGGWEEHMDADDTEWPINWTDESGQPLGIPIAHFKNNGGGYDFGKSELADIIPAQDALNKAVIDEIAGADIEGFRIITLSGGAPPIDSTGASTLEIGPGRAIHAPQGTWGSIPAGNIAGLSAIVDGYVQRMAQMSRTPLAYFQVTGQVAAADTQRADDTGLVSKVERRSVDFGNAWEDAMAIARRLHNNFSSEAPLDEDIMIFTQWASFERVDKGALNKLESETNKTRAETFEILIRNGVGAEQAAKLSGYDDDEAREIGLRGGRRLPQDGV